jgi:hypothetical protein
LRKDGAEALVSADNGMILLHISHMIGGAAATGGLTLSPDNGGCQIRVPPAPRCHQDDGLSIRRLRQPVRIERGKIFHFSICHLAHVRVICDCF